jgi:hypothetical protein
MKEHLDEKQSCVLDNTCPDRDRRAYFLSEIKKYGKINKFKYIFHISRWS